MNALKPVTRKYRCHEINLRRHLSPVTRRLVRNMLKFTCRLIGHEFSADTNPQYLFSLTWKKNRYYEKQYFHNFVLVFFSHPYARPNHCNLRCVGVFVSSQYPYCQCHNYCSTLLYTIHNTMYTLHNTIYTLHDTKYTLRNTKYIILSTEYPMHNTKYLKHNTKYTMHNTKYTLHDTKYTLHNIKYSLHCPMYLGANTIHPIRLP